VICHDVLRQDGHGKFAKSKMSNQEPDTLQQPVPIGSCRLGDVSGVGQHGLLVGVVMKKMQSSGRHRVGDIVACR
jgi:hypothetical protein